MNAKKRKQLKQQLSGLHRVQLVALAKQKTDTPYSELRILAKEALVEMLLPVEGVLKPQQA